MGYRVLVDENLDPDTTTSLRDRGHDAVHVERTLGKGALDPPIARFARRNDRLLLTNDADFLRRERREGLKALFCPKNTMSAHRIAALVDELASFVPDQRALPTATWITDALRSEWDRESE